MVEDGGTKIPFILPMTDREVSVVVNKLASDRDHRTRMLVEIGPMFDANRQAVD
jgi:hypothetical protein